MLFIIGITLIIGPQRTIAFFSRATKLRGTICFILGILLILLKYAFIGFILESFGILGLFGDFFGTIVQFLRSIPYIGDVLSHPLIAPTIDRLAGISNTLPFERKNVTTVFYFVWHIVCSTKVSPCTTLYLHYLYIFNDFVI